MWSPESSQCHPFLWVSCRTAPQGPQGTGLTAGQELLAASCCLVLWGTHGRCSLGCSSKLRAQSYAGPIRSPIIVRAAHSQESFDRIAGPLSWESHWIDCDLLPSKQGDGSDTVSDITSSVMTWHQVDVRLMTSCSHPGKFDRVSSLKGVVGWNA